MTTSNQMQEPFAFWLVRKFLSSSEDQTDDIQPLTNAYTFVTGASILVLLVVVHQLLSR